MKVLNHNIIKKSRNYCDALGLNHSHTNVFEKLNKVLPKAFLTMSDVQKMGYKSERNNLTLDLDRRLKMGRKKNPLKFMSRRTQVSWHARSYLVP